MHQSRLQSLIETIFNTLIGLVVSYLAWPPIAALAGLDFNHGQHIAVTAMFTVISVLRGYVVRRFFNARLQRLAAAIAKHAEPERSK